MAAPRKTLIQEFVSSNGSSGISYSTIIATLGFAGSVIYGGWAFFQSQVINIEKQIAAEHRQAQTLFQNNRDERLKLEKEIKDRILLIEEVQRSRPMYFVGQEEFKQLQARLHSEITIIRDQVKLLEQTRPTSGELHASTSALRDRIEKLYLITERLDEWIHKLHPQQPPRDSKFNYKEETRLPP